MQRQRVSTPCDCCHATSGSQGSAHSSLNNFLIWMPHRWLVLPFCLHLFVLLYLPQLWQCERYNIYIIYWWAPLGLFADLIICTFLVAQQYFLSSLFLSHYGMCDRHIFSHGSQFLLRWCIFRVRCPKSCSVHLALWCKGIITWVIVS